MTQSTSGSASPPELTLTHKDLVDAAMAEIETISVPAAAAMLNAEDTVFVDIRDRRELEREGRIPGAVHAPRGMLEFWIDPSSPYYRDVFAGGKRFVFYCQSAWRSALATQTVQRMGLAPVCHIEGGFRAWQAAEMPVEPVAAKPA